MIGHLHINRDPRRWFRTKSAAAAKNSIATKVPDDKKNPCAFRILPKGPKIWNIYEEERNVKG
jgi:hypothetical protein